MAATLTIPLVTLPAGSRTFGPVTVPDADTAVTLTVDRTPAGGLNALGAASVLGMEAQMSTDGGATWHATDTGQPGTQTAWTAAGGTFTAPRGGAVYGTSAGTWTLFPGTGRRVRATVTVSGPSSIAVAGSLVTQ